MAISERTLGLKSVAYELLRAHHGVSYVVNQYILTYLPTVLMNQLFHKIPPCFALEEVF